MSAGVLATLLSRGLLSATTHGPEVVEAAVAAVASRASASPPAGRAATTSSNVAVPSVYLGLDPTADSLHVGNLLTLTALAHFQRAGFRPVLLFGGATGLIGDPSGRDVERSLLDESDVAANVDALVRNVRATSLLQFDDDGGRSGNAASNSTTTSVKPAVVVNNLDWYASMSAIDLVRDVGKHFRVNAMLARDSVKARLDAGSGMSFTEFSYALFQGYDFFHLHRTMGCVVQLGGADQWGNITAGTDLISRIGDGDAGAVGVTVPLLLTPSGQKFGKSAGNAIWLDSRKTSHYEFYQYFINVEDAVVGDYLRMFTMLPLSAAAVDSDGEVSDAEEAGLTIDAIVEAHEEDPEARLAQTVLASEVTRLVRGDDAVTSAQMCSAVLFGGAVDGINVSDLDTLEREVPTTALPRDRVVGSSVIDVAVAVGACKSKAEARRLAKSGGLYVNNNRVDQGSRVESEDVLAGAGCLLRTGRRKYFLARIQ